MHFEKKKTKQKKTRFSMHIFTINNFFDKAMYTFKTAHQQLCVLLHIYTWYYKDSAV